VLIGTVVGAILAALLTLPLVWKWELGVRRVSGGLITIALLACAISFGVGRALALPVLIAAAVSAILTVAGALGVLAWRFYRDPERNPPLGDDLVVSPADGGVVYIKRSENGRLPVSTKHDESVALQELTRTNVHDGEAIVIGIGMSFLDVHVNRAPIAGRVLLRRHFPGRFGSLGRPEMVFKNERVTIVIAGGKLEVAVVQIASRLVRQIATYVGEGEEVSMGQRIGVIRFGSQVDVVMPNRPDLQVLVRPGDRVEAATSVIAKLASELE
jgi:phosphatidylserine decarboxylase